MVYTAGEASDVIVELRSLNGDSLVAAERETVAAGAGQMSLTINLENVADSGRYRLITGIGQIDANLGESVNTDVINNITIYEDVPLQVTLSEQGASSNSWLVLFVATVLCAASIGTYKIR